jgi:xanthosine utilization system XapX-like protein
MRDYGGFCERRGSPSDCLELFEEDGSWLDEDDKRSIALVLALGPALEARAAELRAMVSPERLAAMAGITVTTYMALLLFPEPASKAVAGVFGLLLWGYLGWEFFELIQAYVQLRQEAARATSWEELRAAGDRFGRVIGPNSVRILVLVGTAAVGESAALVSRMPRLPGFGQAARAVEMNTGVRLTELAEGAERVIVSVHEGSLAVAESSIRVVLPANALAMAAGGQGKGGAVRLRGKALPNGHRAWGSHSGFTKAMGKAGKGKEWHHIVEQTRGNIQRFGPEALHNTENVIPLDKTLHVEVNRLYSAKRMDITSSERLTVRQWLSTQPYEAQRQFGLLAMENIRRGIW